MRVFLLAAMMTAFFLMAPLDTAVAEQAIRLDVAELRGGAVPRVRIAASPHARSAAFYARTADGMVQPIHFTGRMAQDGGGPALRIPAGEARSIRIGGTPGLFVAARTGLRQDREAIFVLLAESLPAGLPETPPIPADVFFRQVAAVAGRHLGALYILPYTIAAAGLPPEASRQGEAVEFVIAFDGIAVEGVLTIADILAVEGDGPLTPVVIGLPETGDGIGFKYRSLAPGSEFRDRLASIVKAAGFPEARIVDHGAGTRLTVISPKP